MPLLLLLLACLLHLFALTLVLLLLLRRCELVLRRLWRERISLALLLRSLVPLLQENSKMFLCCCCYLSSLCLC